MRDLLRLVMVMVLVAVPAFGQTSPLSIPAGVHADVDIVIDGKLDDAVWSRTPHYDGMTISSPDLGEPARYQTHLKLLSTERGLYVGVWMEQPAESLITRLSSRDSFMSRDSYQLILDTSGEGLYGYWFEVSLGGSVGDGTVAPERNFQRSWDGPWDGASAVVEGGWAAEMYLPWGMMSMPRSADGSRVMGIAGSRRVAHASERWTFPYLPRTQPRFMSALQPIALKGINSRQEYSLYPFVSASHDAGRAKSEVNAGLDVFWRPSPNFQINASLTPDFGQVEADDVVINFTAFETFFPEKRLFFLENQEIFRTSPRGSSLLHTRRIGSSVGARRGAPDASDDRAYASFDENQPVDLIGAVKVAGQQGSLRYGLMTAFEDDKYLALDDGSGRHSAPGRDFAVLRLAHEKAGKGARRSVGWLGAIVDHPNRRAVTQGIDIHTLSNGGKLQADLQLMHSDIDSNIGLDTDSAVGSGSGVGGFLDVTYSPKRGHRHAFSVDYFDDQLEINDIGFLGRNDFGGIWWDYAIRRTDVKGLRETDTRFSSNVTFNNDGLFLGGRVRARHEWNFHNNSQVGVNGYFRPGAWDDRNAFGDGSFRRNPTLAVDARYRTDFAQNVVWVMQTNLSEESEGGLSLQHELQLFLRPSSGRASASLTLKYTDRDNWLLYSGDRTFTTFKSTQWSPMLRLDGYFTARQQIRLQLQWVGLRARDNHRWQMQETGHLAEITRAADGTRRDFAVSDMTIQLRYRWEIAPLSDLFVVYNRGGGYDSATIDDDYGDLFKGAFSDPSSEILVAKLRYRFGS